MKQNGPEQTEIKADNDNVVNNLMDKVKHLTKEKERLSKALQHLKENSTIAHQPVHDKQIWVLKKEVHKMQSEVKKKDDTIKDLQNQILIKNLRIEELQKKLGLPINTGPEQDTRPRQAPEKEGLKKKLAQRLKAMF